jgi:fructuronate reductase
MSAVVAPAHETLSPSSMARARATVRRPSYDRAKLTPGIVHLGIGAFARCHLAVVTEDVLEHRAARGQALDLGIIGVSLRRPDQRDLLVPQHALYTMVERGPGAPTARIIGAVLDVLVAPADPGRVLAALTAPSTRIVSLTITEKGYCHDTATGQLRLDHPDIVADLKTPTRPTSAIGYIVEALAQRRAAGMRPFTVLSCDNLMNNGGVVSGLVVALAAQRDAMLAGWIASECRFPATMVDRIVPAATDADRQTAEALTGLVDAAAIAHEPFLQWVIEDDFVAGTRSDWQFGGATFVADVAPYELMKLRMLNASHSALAYLGYLAGYETISDVVGDEVFARYCTCLWRDEVLATLQGIDPPLLERYAATLAERYANPSIRHRTWQIAMDGSLKLPVRIVPTMSARSAAGLSSPCLALAVAGWMRYVGGIDERGRDIDVRDPLAIELRAAHDSGGGDAARTVDALLCVRTIFPISLSDDGQMRQDILDAYQAIATSGTRAAVAALVDRTGT